MTKYKKIYPSDVKELWLSGKSERLIASKLHTSRRQVIDIVKKFKPEMPQHILVQRISKGQSVKPVIRKYGLKKYKEAKAELPKKLQIKFKNKRKGKYQKIVDAIKQYEKPMFQIYAIGFYKKGIVDSEKYKESDKPIPEYRYQGIKGKSDFKEFMSYKHNFKSYRFYDITGQRILLKEMKRLYA